MSQISAPRMQDLATMLSAFEARLAHALPFREDAAVFEDLGAQVLPVLEALSGHYAVASGAPSAPHEGFSVLNLLAQRVGARGATPTAALALSRALVSALESGGGVLSPAQSHELMVIVVEGYAAGRDELREQQLSRSSAAEQVWLALAPGCFGVFLAGRQPAERLERMLDDISRQLFRAEARSVVVDLSRLPDVDEEAARALLGFVTTLTGLGANVFVCGGAQLESWREQLGLPPFGATHFDDFEAARAPALAAGGYELRRSRGRARDWLERVRPGHR